MMSGSAFLCFERTWMKWMSSPSISVTKFGTKDYRDLLGRVLICGRPAKRKRFLKKIGT
jgi:hypothetical protein